MISLPESQPLGAGAEWVAQVEQIFSPTGFLSRSKNFEYRPQQQAMAVAIARALEQGEHLVVEAGTGVGKSLAYLIPSILFAVANRKKAVISTHTINLQEQLSQKDLPMLAEALPVKFRHSLLKGRGNYLCQRRLSKALHQAGGLFTSSEGAELKRIEEWSKTTGEGSLSDFENEPDSRVWAEVCSERGLCSPKLCGATSDFAKDHGVCFFQRARQRMMSAEVLVLNHTLFFTLLAGLEEAPEGGLLFKNDFVVFDEAHTVESVASKHVGIGVSHGQIRFALHRLWNPNTGKGLLSLLHAKKAADLVTELLEEAEHFFDETQERCDELSNRSRDRFAAKPEPETSAPRRFGRESQGEKRGWTEMRIRHPELVRDNVSLPAERLRETISVLIKMTEDGDTAQELIECNRRLVDLKAGIKIFLDQSASHHVYWVERGGKTQRNLSLHVAPIDVAGYLRQRLFESDTSIVMTSATLSISEAPKEKPEETGMDRPRIAPLNQRPKTQGLDYFAKRVGADEATLLQVGSPFDYERQMKLYLVSKMPDPRDAAYRDSLTHWIEHFIEKTHGKAFVLFTNSKLMREMATRMEPFFERLGLECFVQGAGIPRSVMLEKFKNDVNSVLFGADSFWQGVDVPGEALSNVILTRLPFAAPDHPLTEARLEAIEAGGGHAFADFSLPEAILKFRQGIGRLIRSKSDTGIVVVLDNRILSMNYGKSFLAAAPKCPVEVV